MEPQALAELTNSIREHGIIQPLLVSELGASEFDGDEAVEAPRYQLIAGERRLRAAKAAGLDRVPVVVRQSTPQQLLELAIVENVQRADLGPLEEAVAYQRLAEDFGLTQQQVAARVGRSRTAVTNTMRLLELPDEVRSSLARGEITAGHARALLGVVGVEARVEAWRRVVDGGLNVRQTESLVRAAAAPPSEVVPEPSVVRDAAREVAEAETLAVVAALERALGTRVRVRRGLRGRGSVTIHFHNDEELEGVLERLLAGEEVK
jgi:ParB family chromosome partitioning protein